MEVKNNTFFPISAIKKCKNENNYIFEKKII